MRIDKRTMAPYAVAFGVLVGIFTGPSKPLIPYVDQVFRSQAYAMDSYTAQDSATFTFVCSDTANQILVWKNTGSTAANNWFCNTSGTHGTFNALYGAQPYTIYVVELENVSPDLLTPCFTTTDPDACQSAHGLSPKGVYTIQAAGGGGGTASISFHSTQAVIDATMLWVMFWVLLLMTWIFGTFIRRRLTRF